MATLALGGNGNGGNKHREVEHLANAVIVFFYEDEREEYDDDWIDRLVEDSTAIVVVWHIVKSQEDDLDDDWIGPTADHPDLIVTTDDTQYEYFVEDPEDDYLTRVEDVVVVATPDFIIVVLDDQEVDPDSEDDYVSRTDDLVFDIDQLNVVLDDQIDYVEPDSDDDYIYRQDDLVFDIDQVIVVLDDQDVDPDSDDESVIDKIVDDVVVVITDIILSTLDDQITEVPPDEDDDWLFKPDDALSDDLTAVLFFTRDQSKDWLPDEDDDWVIRLDDQVYDVDQITLVSDDQDDLESEDDVYILLITDTVSDTGETIVNLYELDDELLFEEDDWYSSFGQTDEPPFAFGGKQHYEEYKPPKVVKIDSTNIDTIAFDNKTQQLKVKFKSGHTYKYHNVSEKSVKGIKRAKSAGTYFHKNIKGKYLGHKS